MPPVVYLVHHGDAVGPEVDPQRPLSTRGRIGAETLARAAASRGVKPAAVWHSGKLRARQTAEPFWRHCNALAEFSAARGLQPTDPPDWIRDRLLTEERDVLLAGHMPNLQNIRTLLVTGSLEAGRPFPVHGMVALERTGDRWVELWALDEPSGPTGGA
jgi:phosphohistidine phosphatase